MTIKALKDKTHAYRLNSSISSGVVMFSIPDINSNLQKLKNN